MNFSFTDDCRAALGRAREEAIERGNKAVGTEHLLLALIADEEVEAKLRALRVRVADARRYVEAITPRGTASTHRGELPYTSRAKKILELAIAEARQLEDAAVTPGHLLAGTIREGKGIGAQVLGELGVTIEKLRSEARERAVPGARGFRVRIDDASDRSIYEQIVDQITEGIATGELGAGERLPTVRQLADELDIAPGTVARAYGDLERKKLVVTEGARGTYVAELAAPSEAEIDRPETLAGLLRPVAVAAFHLGATAAELKTALDKAMTGIFDRPDRAA